QGLSLFRRGLYLRRPLALTGAKFPPPVEISLEVDPFFAVQENRLRPQFPPPKPDGSLGHGPFRGRPKGGIRSRPLEFSALDQRFPSSPPNPPSGPKSPSPKGFGNRGLETGI